MLDATGVVLLSPIAQMEPHLRAHSSSDPAFRAWAKLRFGHELEDAVSGDARTLRCEIPVTMLIPADDEIVEPAGTQQVALAQGWRIVLVPGAHYPRNAVDAGTRWKEVMKALGM